MFALFGLVILSALLGRLAFWFGGSSGSVSVLFDFEPFARYFGDVWYPRLRFVSYLISILAFIGICYAVSRTSKIAKAERIKYNTAPISEAASVPRNGHWEKVMAHLNSQNPNDWKVAIIEADIMLDELLDKMGYQGATIGDKLKTVEQSDFLTLNEAWEAHKVRNQIAHEGAAFMLSDREARRVMSLYEKVFREFGVV